MLSNFQKSIGHHKVLVKLVSLLLGSTILGYFIVLEFQPIETNVELNQSTVTREVSQSDGPYTISYTTTGPAILSFEKNCDGGKGSLLYYCGINLHYDGKSGVVELRIPVGLMEEIDPIHEVLVSYFYPIQIPFQKISHDDYYSVFRIEVPANYSQILLQEGTGIPEPGSFLLSTFLAADCIFFVLMFLFLGIEEMTKKIRRLKIIRP